MKKMRKEDKRTFRYFERRLLYANQLSNVLNEESDISYREGVQFLSEKASSGHVFQTY